jgi:predicted Na+-dependent transporter
MLAISPGGLLALQFARLSKGDRVFAVALVIVLTILAILITHCRPIGFFSDRRQKARLSAAGIGRGLLLPLMGNVGQVDSLEDTLTRGLRLP